MKTTQTKPVEERTVLDRATEAFMAALERIEQNEGKEGFWQPYDKALHLYTALNAAGLKVVRCPPNDRPRTQ